MKPLQGFDNKDSIKEKLFLRKFSSSFSPSGALYSSKQINTYASPWERAKDLCESADIPLKKISLLGSTGSIGRQTLSVVNSCSNNFRIVALAANSNVKLLAEQIKDFRPEAVSLRDESKIDELKQLLQSMGVFEFPEIYGGEEGIIQIAKHPTADTVVTGIVGCAGLKPTIAAIKSKKNIALANKETLIAAGPVIIPLLREYGNTLSPADSEHSAIFQCLQGVPEGSIKRLILTASGGSFRDKKKEDLQNVTLDDALKHPNWSMGKKITIDSATLMNKGLEVIEAHFLFGVDYKNIDVLIHPQSIIHSMVELTDTSMLAQLGIPDMRLPLLYALSYPHRFKMDYKSLDLAEVKTLDFRHPDTSMFPCLELAYEAGKIGGTAPAAINAANEQAVSMFCDGKIKFVDIPVIIEKVLMSHTPKKNDLTVEDITEVDLWGRKKAEEVSK